MNPSLGIQCTLVGRLCNSHARVMEGCISELELVEHPRDKAKIKADHGDASRDLVLNGLLVLVKPDEIDWM